MKLKCLLVPFKSKLFTKPCTKLPQIFKFSFKFKKLICIRALTCHRKHRSRPTKTVKTTTHGKNRIRGFFSIFRQRKRSTTTSSSTNFSIFRRRKRSTTTSSSTNFSIFRRRKRSTTSSSSTNTISSSSASSRRSLFSIFRRRRQRRRSTSVVEVEEEIEDELGEMINMTTTEAAAGPQEKKIFPSPLTPAYVRLISGSAKNKVRGTGQNFDDVDDACQSFENYLVEMIVEEGKLADLMDVEQLLYCWKNLKCPVFRDMVCRFYGELCRDLFSSVDQDDYDMEEKAESSIDDHHFK